MKPFPSNPTELDPLQGYIYDPSEIETVVAAIDLSRRQVIAGISEELNEDEPKKSEFLRNLQSAIDIFRAGKRFVSSDNHQVLSDMYLKPLIDLHESNDQDLVEKLGVTPEYLALHSTVALSITSVK